MHQHVAVKGGGLDLRHRGFDPIGHVGHQRIVCHRGTRRLVTDHEDGDAVMISAPVIDLLCGPPTHEDCAGTDGTLSPVESRPRTNSRRAESKRNRSSINSRTRASSRPERHDLACTRSIPASIRVGWCTRSPYVPMQICFPLAPRSMQCVCCAGFPASLFSKRGSREQVTPVPLHHRPQQ